MSNTLAQYVCTIIVLCMYINAIVINSVQKIIKYFLTLFLYSIKKHLVYLIYLFRFNHFYSNVITNS